MLPRSWQGGWGKDGTFFAYTPGSAAHVATGVTVTSERTAGLTVAQYARRARAQTIERYASHDPAPLVRMRRIALPAGRAYVLTMRARVTPDGQLGSLRVYVLVHRGRGYAFSFQTLYRLVADDTPTFERAARSIRFRPGDLVA